MMGGAWRRPYNVMEGICVGETIQCRGGHEGDRARGRARAAAASAAAAAATSTWPGLGPRPGSLFGLCPGLDPKP